MSEEIKYEDVPEVEVVFLGRRIDQQRKKIYYLFIPYSEVQSLESDDFGLRTEDVERHASWYELKKQPDCIIGHLYTMKAILKEDSKKFVTIWPMTLKFVRSLNISMTEIWKQQDRLVQQFKQHESHIRKIKENGLTEKAVDHLSWVFKNMPPGQRNAWLITIMREISK